LTAPNLEHHGIGARCQGAHVHLIHHLVAVAQSGLKRGRLASQSRDDPFRFIAPKEKVRHGIVTVRREKHGPNVSGARTIVFVPRTTIESNSAVAPWPELAATAARNASVDKGPLAARLANSANITSSSERRPPTLS
jgi:hypothetical protein